MRYVAAVLLVALSCGCVMSPCREPMRSVGGECCVDGNANGVCDRRENISAIPECTPPYIPYGEACCPDSNGNRVCDSLEAPPPTSATLPEETTTTATEPPSTTTTASTATTTSTTQNAPPTTLPPTTSTVPAGVVCYDSDGGENLRDSGTTTGPDRPSPHDRVARTDRCADGKTLIEYRCQDDRVYQSQSFCGTGRTCLDGRCCIPEGTECKASADCCSGQCFRKLYVSLCY
jgi:hypothetical protein